MEFEKFLAEKYRALAGSAVPIGSVIKHFYKLHANDPTIAFRFSPNAIRRYLEKRFPIGLLYSMTMVGNLFGPDNYSTGDREVVAFLGMLVPRDLRPDEFAAYRRLAENDSKLRRHNTTSAAAAVRPVLPRPA